MGVENPKISVVIPVKNKENVIARCVEAVHSQSHKPYEVIVVDGHSADRTVEEAKKFPVKIVSRDSDAFICRISQQRDQVIKGIDEKEFFSRNDKHERKL